MGMKLMLCIGRSATMWPRALLHPLGSGTVSREMSIPSSKYGGTRVETTKMFRFRISRKLYLFIEVTKITKIYSYNLSL